MTLCGASRPEMFRTMAISVSHGYVRPPTRGVAFVWILCCFLCASFAWIMYIDARLQYYY